MLKVLHINSFYITNYLHSELVKKLDDFGIKQHIFVPVKSKSDIGKNYIGELKNGDLNYAHCFTPFSRKLWPLKMFQIWGYFNRKVLPTDSTIVHGHTLFVNGLISYWNFLKNGTPYIVTLRNTDINTYLKRIPFTTILAMRIMENAKAIVALSPAYANIQLRRYLKGDDYKKVEKKLTIINMGINDFWIENRFKKQGRSSIPTIIFVGTMDKNKNLTLLLKACSILNSQAFRIRLLAVGDGPLLNKFKGVDYDFEVKFFGRIDDKFSLLHLYRLSDLLVVPSYTDSFGRVYAEAMSQSLPIIYTAGQGFDGFFKNGEVGFAINPDNVAMLVDAIKEVYNNYDLMSSSSYKLSLEFSWHKTIEKLNSLYQKCISS